MATDETIKHRKVGLTDYFKKKNPEPQEFSEFLKRYWLTAILRCPARPAEHLEPAGIPDSSQDAESSQDIENVWINDGAPMAHVALSRS